MNSPFFFIKINWKKSLQFLNSCAKSIEGVVAPLIPHTI
jgi:hypothetical protein